jgi:hypothetical protein
LGWWGTTPTGPTPPGFFFIAGCATQQTSDRGPDLGVYKKISPAAQKRYITVKIGVYRCTPVPVYRCTPLPVYPYTPFVKKIFRLRRTLSFLLHFSTTIFFDPGRRQKKKIKKIFACGAFVFQKSLQKFSKIFKIFQNFQNWKFAKNPQIFHKKIP